MRNYLPTHGAVVITLKSIKMTTTQVVKTSVTNNSLSKDYPHPDDHAKQTMLNLLESSEDRKSHLFGFLEFVVFHNDIVVWEGYFL